MNVKDATKRQLRDEGWLENAIYEAGIYPAQEIPKSLWKLDGGIGICQYPTQLAPYLIELSKLDIRRYAEIGVWVGGTFRFTIEYLSRFELRRAMAIDIDVKPAVRDFCERVAMAEWVEAPSDSPKAAKALKGFKPDLILVDGDHTEQGARADCELALSIAPYVAVHDIVGDGFPGVRKVWGEIDGKRKLEFTTQHPDQPLSQNGMGLIEV